MSQCRSDFHILLHFSIYFPGIFTKLGGLVYINLEPKKKVTMSETFEKSQMSFSFDVPAGCNICYKIIWCLPSTTKLQQGNIFTSVCHSVQWGCLPGGWVLRMSAWGVSVRRGVSTLGMYTSMNLGRTPSKQEAHPWGRKHPLPRSRKHPPPKQEAHPTVNRSPCKCNSSSFHY